MNKSHDDYDTWVYRKLPIPTSKIVKQSQAVILFKKGWTDNPAKFSMGMRGFIINAVYLTGLTLKKFWFDHWKWIIGITINLVLGIIGLYIAWLQLKAPK